MRDLKMMTLVLVSMALLPGIASATHLSDVAVWGDCEGWVAQVDVTWRSSIYTGDLDFSISLMDGDIVLETYNWAGPIGRALDDPSDMTYMFEGSWVGTFEGPVFGIVGQFHLVAPWEGGIDEGSMSDMGEFQCTVATETSTWGTVKSLYR
jgi:hypothetical protein